MNDLQKFHAMEVVKGHFKDLQVYLDDPQITEIMINHANSIWYEKSGEMFPIDIVITNDQIDAVIKVMAGVNEKSVESLIDARFPDMRIAAARPPISVAGPSMSIRKHTNSGMTLERYQENGALNPYVEIRSDNNVARPDEEAISKGGDGLAQFIRWMVVNCKNFIVPGGTSSGKTTFLNACIKEIPQKTRFGTIEDTAELKPVTPNLIQFEANKDLGIDIRRLVKHMLRCRPDRFWIGEVRGAEMFDVMDAFNTGHAGGALTLHADSPLLALARIESMVRMSDEGRSWPLEDLRAQIASTFEYVIHCARVGSQRGPVEVIEILGVENGRYKTRSLFKKTYSMVH